MYLNVHHSKYCIRFHKLKSPKNLRSIRFLIFFVLKKSSKKVQKSNSPKSTRVTVIMRISDMIEYSQTFFEKTH